MCVDNLQTAHRKKIAKRKVIWYNTPSFNLEISPTYLRDCRLRNTSSRTTGIINSSIPPPVCAYMLIHVCMFVYVCVRSLMYRYAQSHQYRHVHARPHIHIYNYALNALFYVLSNNPTNFLLYQYSKIKPQHCVTFLDQSYPTLL